MVLSAMKHGLVKDLIPMGILLCLCEGIFLKVVGTYGPGNWSMGQLVV